MDILRENITVGGKDSYWSTYNNGRSKLSSRKGGNKRNGCSRNGSSAFSNGGRHYNSSSVTEPRKARYKEIMERKSKQMAEAVPPKAFVPSLGFKLTAATQTNAHKCRGLHKSCSNCISSTKFVNDAQIGAPLTDILSLPRHSVRGPLGSLCPYLVWAVTKPLVKPLIDPKQSTKNSPRVTSAIHESALVTMNEENIDYETAKKKQERKANQIISTMSGNVYGWLLKLSSYTLHWVFSSLFNRLLVQSGHIEMLLEAQKENVPIVFLPSHKSHLDYILISFVLVNIGVKAPHIAAGDNLNIPVFNWLIHHLGGWFIRRRLDNCNNIKDRLYRSCLHEYMEQLLKANQNIEFYIEGSRSRTGKPALPKGGLLSVLVETIREGIVSDIILVPTSVTYDKILERNFMRHELLGGSKKPENFIKGLKGVWSMLTKSTGCARMDFAQPFSLREYLFKHEISSSSLMDLSLPSLPSSPAGAESDRHLVNALGYHIVYDFNSCAPIMATNIIGFMLLTTFRNGGSMHSLISQYDWIVSQISTWGRYIGYPGSSSEAVLYGLSYMNHLVTMTTTRSLNGGMESYFIAPKLELPDVFELLHHSNQVSLGFIKESIIACAITVCLSDLSCEDDFDSTSEHLPPQKTLQLSQTKLLDNALFIAQVFAREFIYSPPCVDISMSLFEGIESLKRAEVLTDPQSSGIDRFSNNYKTSRELWEDYDDEEDYYDNQMFEVSRSTKSTEHVSLLMSVLGSYIEGYWNCAMYIDELADENGQMRVDEQTFLKSLQTSLLTPEGTTPTLYYVESCSSDILRNALKSYIGMGVVSVDENGLLVVENSEKLQEINQILSICKI